MKTVLITDEMLLDKFMDEQFEKNTISVSFPEDVASLLAQDLTPAPCKNRMDLRRLPCLTIDCDDVRDMDDAVSLVRTKTGYLLGVHIADVAAYVRPGSRLDEIAAERGSSIYLANRTIPMLPPVLSQDLCSLNPNEDRNALSVLIDITKDGQVRRYMVTKSLIRSRVKGVYSEINSIFSRNASPAVVSKYRSFIPALWDMKGLTEKLRRKRCAAGANTAPSEEVKITVQNGEIQLALHRQGASELLIEEFMVLCNSLVAEYCQSNHIPCLFRTQDKKNTLAKYEPCCGRHADLAIEDTGYLHFTSPIRRYSDCVVHQTVSAWLDGASAEELNARYNREYMEEVALIATKRFRRAKAMQLVHSKFCFTRYFACRREELYLGRVIGYNKQQRPILCMDAYPIHVLGDLALRAQIGEKFSFRISADVDNRKLYAELPRRVAA
ncbi:MAG: RNB domain-containing ribonuclease [Oscillospiraceae bacterium]|nr:RNB domain-containing ribonuclease [Oscillospiraceae bacterium]